MAIRARIYQRAKVATQSGRAKAGVWVLEYEPAAARRIDALTGWTSSSDMLSQVRIEFATREEAEVYAQARGLEVVVEGVMGERRERRSYADNFRSDRRRLWTH